MPYVSANALAGVLQEIAEHGAPELHTRQAMAAATSSELRRETPYGSMLADLPLTSVRNTAMSLPAINPLSLLVTAYEQGGSFTAVFDRAYAAKPPTPEEP